MLIVVSYDVATTSPKGRTRLRKIARECLNHGQRVQNSVFECSLENDTWTRLKLRLLDLMDPAEDSLRFYYLGSNWRGRVEHHGTKPIKDLDEPLIL